MAFPKSQPEINALLQLWKAKLKTWQELYTITDEFATQIKTDATVYNHLLSAAQMLETDRNEFFAYKKSLFTGDKNAPVAAYPTITLAPLPSLAFDDSTGTPKAGIESRAAEFYNFLRGHPNRTDESLSDLGVNGKSGGGLSSNAPEQALKRPALKPQAKSNGTVEIGFNKQGEVAVRFWMRRGASAEWTHVGDAFSNPFVDQTASTSGAPEKREYRTQYLRNNQPYGEFSAIETVYTTP